MKHYLPNSLRALFLSLAVLLSLPMLAVEIGGINYDFDLEAKQATVIKKSSGKYSGEVVIPESVEHEGAAYSVESIGERAFYECSGLTSVTIPNSVTSIGNYAFRYCSGLTSVTIGNNVKSIGDEAFWGCSGLTSVHISDIAAWCNIHFGDNPLHYAHHLYFNGEEVKDLVIPNSVTSIEYGAFSGCFGLTSVTIPNSVWRIGIKAFSDCSGLTSVTIPNSVLRIENMAFEYCSGLTSVAIPDSVWRIGDSAFAYCSGLTSVTIGNSVKFIGDAAFSYCSGLTSVTIPNSVTSIGIQAFYWCDGLTSVTIGNSVEKIWGHAFNDCSKLLDVYCYAENVPSTDKDNDAFYRSNYKNATLHVPAASIDSYKATEPWSRFGKIVALTEDETGIDELKGENGTEKSAAYDLSGRRVQKGEKGIFIRDGKVVLVR